MGDGLKINYYSFKKKYSYEYFFLNVMEKHSKLTYMHTIITDGYIIKNIEKYQSVFI